MQTMTRIVRFGRNAAGRVQMDIGDVGSRNKRLFRDSGAARELFRSKCS